MNHSNRLDGLAVARWLARIIIGLNFLAVATGLVLKIIHANNDFDAWPVNAVVYSVLAGLIISRQSRHVIGWLILISGFFSSQAVFVGALWDVIKQSGDANLPIELLASTGQLYFIPSLMIPPTLLLQYFPNGRLPSRRYWPIPAASLLGMVGYGINLAFFPWTLEDGNFVFSNPLAIPGAEKALETLLDVANPALAMGIVGSLLILLVRYRRSAALERAQMKWLFYVAGIALTILLFSEELFGAAGESVSFHLFAAMPSILGLPIGIAILRYRLFDIDIIIRRTLQYGLLTGLLALAYFGLVVTLQSVFAVMGDIQSEIFIVISTLVIAGLFNPLRRRIQKIVDRRFYREKYDAKQALARFAATTRDEVDLDKLEAALLAVVEETMRPDSASLWIASENLSSDIRNQIIDEGPDYQPAANFPLSM